MKAPGFLQGYEDVYREDPRRATLKWFAEGKYGLFIHYGLYSVLGQGEWVQYHDRIPIAEYAQLEEQFAPDGFDAEFIADLAVEAGMKYVNLVCKHCDSFCLWDTRQTEFNSVNTAAERDLVQEMADACRGRGLGFFAFYEHGFDWRHPHGPAPWDWKMDTVRPHYDPPDPFYASREDYDFREYVDYATRQIAELCTRYGPLAGVWLDGAAIPLAGDKSKFRIRELYALIRTLQPQALISYKFGVEPELEDFFAPEEGQIPSIIDRMDKPMEICTTMQKGRWGYAEDREHLSAAELWEKILFAAQQDANLLINVGPLGDGSIHPEDVVALREVGERLRADGWPSQAKAANRG
jgi:alpha-L-fucosidase